MASLTLTAKRQATFPKDACESLGVKPGDVIDLESREEGGNKVWILKPRPVRKRSWVGCLEKQAKKVADHSLESVRESIAKGRKYGE